MTDLRSWWNSLDVYWKRVFKIILKPEFESNKAARDSYTPTDDELSDFVARQELTVKNASVTNLDPLLAFYNLNKLSIAGLVNLKSTTALSQLKSLKHLSLDGVPASLLTFLRDLPDIEILMLAGSNLKSLHNIKSLHKLKKLSISEPYLESLADLTYQPDLEELWLKINLSNIESLPPLAKLKKLTIANSNVVSIEPLKNQTSLTTLILFDIPIRSLAGIENLIHLESLNLDLCPVGDLSPLSNLTNLSSLSIRHTQIKNLSQIYPLKQLKSLSITTGNFELEDMEQLMATFPNCQITKPAFSFREGKHYRVLKTFQSGEQMFREGMQLAFLESYHNSYEGFVNCTFSNLATNEKLFWSFYDLESEKCEQLFQLIRYPKS